jgi:hypothetical protein
MAGWSTPIPDEQAGEVLRWYEGLEEQVRDFIRVVPPYGTNLQVWSPKVATVLVEACCLVESIFHRFRDDAATVQDKPKPRDRLTLGDYAKLYSALLRLPDRTAILLTDKPACHRPFTCWTDLRSDTSFKKEKHEPTWWALYNRSKHSRIGVFNEFTLATALDALAAALVVIMTVPAFALALVQHEWLPSAGWSVEQLLESYVGLVSLRGPLSSDTKFTIGTQLFAVPVGYDPPPHDSKDFRPSRHGISPRLLQRFPKF